MAGARCIGMTRREAIDWTQDTLRTTRPVAEATLSALLEDNAALETEQGVLLLEDDDEVQRRARNAVHHVARTTKFRFHRRRGLLHERHKAMQRKKALHTLQWTDSAEAMLDGDGEE